MANQNLSDIWESWRREEQPCRSCPNFDSDKTFSPSYGGNENANIMILADSPNRTDRDHKNASDCDVPAESKDDYAFSEVDYLETIIGSGWSIESFLNHFCHNSDLSPDTLYVTNAKKCADIGKDEWSQKNTRARARCQTWLDVELDVVDPDVIVVLGKPAIKAVNSFFNLNIPARPKKESFRIERKWGYSLIVGAHWSNDHFNSPDSFSGEGAVKEYRSELGKKASEEIK